MFRAPPRSRSSRIPKQLYATTLFLMLAGCAGFGGFNQPEPTKLAVPTEQVLPPTKQLPHKSLAARAEAPKTEANETLMPCVSDACKLRCSSDVELKPKWCMYFKQPI
jgi:hypothetical protein